MKSGEIIMGREPCGIEFYGAGRFRFNIETYLEDFEKAVNTYVEQIETNPDELRKVKVTLEKKQALL